MTGRDALHDRMLQRAGDLFYAEGIGATGVDRVAEVVGVSKRTLYKHFGTKDNLVVECLRARDQPLRDAFAAGATAAGADPADQLRALFSALAPWLEGDTFRGCPYVNSVGELADPDHPARAVAVAHKTALRDWIRVRADAAGAEDPDQLAAALLVLFDGTLAQRLVLGDAFDLAPVLAAADTLITCALRPPA